MFALVHDQTPTDKDSAQTRASLEALSNQLQLGNRAASRFRTRLPGREEAIAQLNREANQADTTVKPYLSLFIADVLLTLRSRHGNEVSEYLLDELSRTNILPLIPDGKLFRWSTQSILVTWRSTQSVSEVSSYISNSCRMPFHCQAFVGTRTALFQINVRSFVLEIQKNTTELARSLDRAAKGVRTR